MVAMSAHSLCLCTDTHTPDSSLHTRWCPSGPRQAACEQAAPQNMAKRLQGGSGIGRSGVVSFLCRRRGKGLQGAPRRAGGGWMAAGAAARRLEVMCEEICNP